MAIRRGVRLGQGTSKTTEATANYRACLEPGNITMALEIRDDKTNKIASKLASSCAGPVKRKPA